ncbi:MAG: AraC family transcriptional regulator, partial [Lachnospiraceae bacterium]|nr:AraC family transcriptional regulator [Lachnospiraceae bacterium]
PGELHSIMTETPESHWEDAVVFSTDILSFDSCDEAQIHLIKPMQKGKLLFPRCIMPEHPAFAPVRDAFLDIMHSFGQMAQEDSLAKDSSLVTNDLTSQLYIKSSLLYIIATLSGSNLFVPTERNMDKRVESIKTALTYIRENYREKIYIADLAGQVNLNEQYFCRLFKKAIGSSPIEYINEYRIKQAKRLLEESDLPVTEVCLECGYNNLGNFLREFRKHSGMTPLQYRKQSQKVKIQ